MDRPNAEEIKRQLDRILSSAKFKDAGRARRFLEFIVTEALAGKSAELKENIVGVSVFERSPDYDPRLDSIVRVEAGRLRTKLNDYYNDEGRNDSIDIQLPKGSYAPEFSWRTNSTPIGSERKSNRRLWFISAATLVVLTLTIAWFARPTPHEIRIAILPFTPYTTDERDRMIADQLTQKVTAEFVKLGAFNVVPSTSTRSYEDRRPSVREIAAALQADILLEAKTTTTGKSTRVEVRLSDGALDRKFWVGDQYVGENVDDLAKQIAVATEKAVMKRKQK